MRIVRTRTEPERGSPHERDGEYRTDDGPLAAGVIGVGSMRKHHARVYSELPDAELVVATDVDAGRSDTETTDAPVYSISGRWP